MSFLGTWTLTITSPLGTQHPTIAFTDEGGTVIGTMTAPTGETGTVDALAIDGNKATWKANVMSPMGPLNLAFAAAVEGDSLTGTVTAPMGAIPITGVREA